MGQVRKQESKISLGLPISGVFTVSYSPGTSLGLLSAVIEGFFQKQEMFRLVT